MSGRFECNNENIPLEGFRSNNMMKTRAQSLGHELKDQGIKKKRLSDTTNIETDSHSDKLRRSHDYNHKGQDVIGNQRKPSSQAECKSNVYIIKPDIHRTVNNDENVPPPGGVHNKTARLKRKNRENDKNAEITDIPISQRIVSKVEPMDTEHQVIITRNCIKGLPIGVHDIDLIRCPLYVSVYGKDIMDYLQNRDITIQRSADYTSKGEITNKMRGVLIDWLGQVQTFEGLTSESLHLCVYMIDQFLTVKLLPFYKLQLLGITCLLIASKVVERFPPEIPKLCQLTAGTYEPHEVLTMEKEVLNVLMFDLNVPGPIVFLDRYLQVDKHEEEIENLCLYLMDLSLTHTKFVPYSASRLAASSLYLSRFLFHSGPSWTQALTYYTKYTVDNLRPCVQLFAHALNKAETSSFQNARTKFNTSTFGYISMNGMLSRCEALICDNGNNT